MYVTTISYIHCCVRMNNTWSPSRESSLLDEVFYSQPTTLSYDICCILKFNKLNIGVFRFYLKFLGFTERDLDYIALQILYSTNFIFTARKQSCGKVMFLHLSVSHSVQRGGLFQHTTSRGCVSQHAMGRGMYTHRQTLHCPGQTSPRQTCPWADTSPGQTPPHRHPRANTPWADTLPRQTPLGRHPPRQTPLRDSHWSGRYASYWNAFLCEEQFTSFGVVLIKIENTRKHFSRMRNACRRTVQGAS